MGLFFGEAVTVSEQKVFSLKKNVKADDPLVLIDFLEKHSQLSKSTLKKVLNNGGVWWRKQTNSKRVRIRKAKADLTTESLVELFFDPKFISLEVPEAKVVYDQREWGLWYKPQGLLSQGTDFGDHCTILRQVEKIKGKSFLVHRLDREAHGLMLIAYSQKAAAAFSLQWQKGDVKKFYKVEVLGDISERYQSGGEINFNLDGKEARTTFSILKNDMNSSILLVQIHTGRLHQIRRHFDMIGFPVMGDPKYGKGNKNYEGIRLMAYKLEFHDPFAGKNVSYSLDEIVF